MSKRMCIIISPIKGENLTFRWFDGQEHSDNIIIAGTSEKSFNEGFYLTPETIKKFLGRYGYYSFNNSQCF